MSKPVARHLKGMMPRGRGVHCSFMLHPIVEGSIS